MGGSVGLNGLFLVSPGFLDLRHFVVWSRMAFCRPSVVGLLLSSASPIHAQDAGNQMTVVAALRTSASAESGGGDSGGAQSPDVPFGGDWAELRAFGIRHAAASIRSTFSVPA